MKLLIWIIDREILMFRWLGRKKSDRPLEQSNGTSVRTFLGGAYRLHLSEDIEKFTALAAQAFPDVAERITCFASDWAGRQFATDEARLIKGERQILLLEPGTGEALHIPAGLDTFHTGELVQQPDAVAGVSFFHQWLAVGGQAPMYGQCVGYKKPLFLGGEDEVTNLELVDFAIYWVLAAQILEQVRGLPVGTRIGSISIGD
jgi:hypothetical protein